VDVDWGDGTTHTTFSTSTISSLGTRGHTYGEEGTFTVTVKVTDTADGRSDSKTYKVTVADPAVTPTGSAFVAVEGFLSGSQPVATFTDPGGAEVLGDYSATIAWGDSSTSPGAISFDGSTTFTVSGAHLYGEEGTFTITTTIHHDAAPDASTTSTATVSDPAVVATGVPVSAVEGAAFTASIATFTDPGGPEPNASDPSGTLANHYTVDSIDWGDTTPLDTTSGTISFDGTSTFTVQGGHTYGEEGTYTITATLDHEGILTTVMATATVSDPAVVATPIPVFGVTCLSKTVTLATFTDPGGPEPNASDPSGTLANHYKVDSIDWGDATPLDTASGTITFDGTSTFTVTGTHAYANEGVFTVTVILDHEGVLTTVMTTATIKDDIGLLLLDQTGSKSLMVTGNGNVDVTGCGVVVVDSSDASAAFVTGLGSVTAQDIDVTGGVKTAGHGSFSTPVEQEPATADPLGLGLPAPPAPIFAAVNYSGSAALTLDPGTYVGGIRITGGNVTLNPGVYYMQGGGFSVTGKGSVTGMNVLIVNAPSKSSDTITITCQGSVTLTALAGGTDKGVVILQDPNSSNTVKITGQGAVTLTGVVYVPDALVQITGNGNVTINPGPGTATLPPILGALIAFDLKVDGNGVLTINPDDPPAAAMMATTMAGSIGAPTTGSSPLLLVFGQPITAPSATSATVTTSGGTTPAATPTIAASAYLFNTGPTADGGGSVWDLFSIDAANLFSGLPNGEIGVTI
jgi:PKD repeat protein